MTAAAFKNDLKYKGETAVNLERDIELLINKNQILKIDLEKSINKYFEMENRFNSEREKHRQTNNELIKAVQTVKEMREQLAVFECENNILKERLIKLSAE